MQRHPSIGEAFFPRHISLISGLANPTEGKVLYDDADLSEQDRYRYRSHDISVIFQSFNLLPSLTVAENIILQAAPLTDHARPSGPARIAQPAGPTTAKAP